MQQPKQYSPRRFPTKQYRKLGHQLWSIVIGIIVIILIAAGVFTTATVNKHHTVHHPVKVTRSIKRPRSKPVRHSADLKVTPKRGEKLLGHWLIKLHYSSSKSQEFLNHYQQSTPQRDVQIGQRLKQLSRNKTSAANQRNRIRHFIDHQLNN